MGDFLRQYRFFSHGGGPMLLCYLAHRSHGGKGQDEDGKGPAAGRRS
jgi:hypothetical protein